MASSGFWAGLLRLDVDMSNVLFENTYLKMKNAG